MIKLSKFYVTVANKKYSQLNSDYDIIVQEYTEFSVIRDVPPISIRTEFQFHLLGEMELLKIDGLYGWYIADFISASVMKIFRFFTDAIGVIKSVGALTVVHERVSFKPLPIVRLLLFDSTGDMEVNLWNDLVCKGFKILRSLIVFFLLFYSGVKLCWR